MDVSTELVEASDGMLAPAASPSAVKFSAAGSGPLARVQTSSGAWMTVASPVGSLPDGVVDDSSVTYPEVLDWIMDDALPAVGKGAVAVGGALAVVGAFVAGIPRTVVCGC